MGIFVYASFLGVVLGKWDHTFVRLSFVPIATLILQTAVTSFLENWYEHQVTGNKISSNLMLTVYHSISV
jgi:hypothetical protein